jgi:hypothetical protein
MAETSDFSVLVEIVQNDFHSSHEVELFVHLHKLLLISLGFSGKLNTLQQESFRFSLYCKLKKKILNTNWTLMVENPLMLYEKVNKKSL